MSKILLRQLAHSKSLDLFGTLLILVVCIERDFHETYFYPGEIQFGIAITDFWAQLSKGSFPLGILSTGGAIFSMLSTRLIGKQSNIGNMIGVATTVNSCMIDYLFGNHSAVLTYPISYFLFPFL